MSESLPYCLEITEWETPATKYPPAKFGSARITRETYRKGYYRMEAVKGYMFYRLKKPIQVTNLEINGQVSMVDDPLHWYGMQALAEHSTGKVLVGGLGLGLIVHALLQNKDVAQIDVVEINPDVIALIKPRIPTASNLQFHNDSIYAFAHYGQNYDTVIIDLWIKSSGSRTEGAKIYAEMMTAFAVFKKLYPKANIYIWGLGDSSINPSVDPDIRKAIPPDYYRSA